MTAPSDPQSIALQISAARGSCAIERCPVIACTTGRASNALMSIW